MAIIIGLEGPDDSLNRLIADRPGFTVGRLLRMPLAANNGKWHCLTCEKEFDANFEPDHCPDCGTQLVRLRHRSINIL